MIWKSLGNMIAEITTGGNSRYLLVVCRLRNLACTMKESKDLHDVILFKPMR